MSADVRPTVFVTTPSAHLRCGICHKVYSDPVINVNCGHTFCRNCISASIAPEERAAGGRFSCPVDDSSCGLSSLVVNRAIIGQIEELLIHCRYAVTLADSGEYVLDESGCPDKILIGSRNQHEDICPYANVLCPNSSKCGLFRKADLPTHLETCKRHPCSFKNRGCEFNGNQKLLVDHLSLCGYRNIHSSDKVSAKLLNEQLGTVRSENQMLLKTVQQLSDRVKVLETEREDINHKLHSYQSCVSKLEQRVDELQQSLETKGYSSSATSSVVMTTASKPVQTKSSLPSSPTRSASSSLIVKHETWTTPLIFKCLGTFRGHKGPVYALVNSASCVFSGSGDGSIKVWNIDFLGKGCIHTITAHSDAIYTLAIHGDLIYSAGADLTIKAWNIKSYEEVTVANQTHSNIICMLVCSDNFVFSSSYSVIKVWNCKTLELVHTIDGLYHWVRALAINKAKDKLYSGSHNTIEIWNATGKFNLKGKIDHHYGSIHSLAVTSKYIIAGSYNQNIHIFSVSTHQHVSQLQGHVGAVTRLLVSPSENFLFSGSADHSVQIWKFENMLSIHSLCRHEGSVDALGLYGDLLLSGSEDTEIKVYKYFKIETMR